MKINIKIFWIKNKNKMAMWRYDDHENAMKMNLLIFMQNFDF
jgi:hypothetical protein